MGWEAFRAEEAAATHVVDCESGHIKSLASDVWYYYYHRPHAGTQMPPDPHAMISRDNGSHEDSSFFCPTWAALAFKHVNELGELNGPSCQIKSKIK
jgi:hypothetical protein